MKRNTVTRLLVLFLSLIMVFSLVACGKKPTSEENKTDTNKVDESKKDDKKDDKRDVTESKDDTKPDVAEPEDGPLTKCDPAITVTTAYQIDDSVTIPGGMTASDNLWTDAYRDLLGINVVNDYEIAGWDAYVQQVNLMVTSGDVPDIFWVTPDKMNELVEAGLIADLTDVYDKYASDVLKQEHKIDEAVLGGATINGRLYGIPQVNLLTLQETWVRQDWREKLNIDKPETFDELIDLLYAFTFNDPDGNGKNDTYGMSASLNYERYSFIYNAFHAYPGLWYKDDSGQIVYGSVQPQVKEALKVLRQLYADGVISPDALANDYGASNGDFANGECGALNVPQYGITGFRGIFETIPDVKLETYGPFSVDSKPALASTNNPLARIWVVSSKCEHPEAAVKLANLNIGTLYEIGYAGTDPQLNQGFKLEDGGLQNLNFLQTVRIESLLNHVKLADAMRGWGNGTYDLEYMTANRLNEEAINLRMGGDKVQSQMWSPEFGSITTTYLNLYEAHAYQVDLYNKPSKTMGKSWSSLKDMENETFVRIIMGEEELDAFDDYVNKWYQLDGQTILDEMRELYK